jgi:hypothetical protein
LRGETSEAGAELFDSSIEGLVNSWKKRVIRHFKTLFKRERVNHQTTFYSDILNLTWEQTLYKYMGIKTETLAPLKTQSVKGFISDTVFNVFLSKTYLSIAKPNLVEVKTKVNSKPEIYFSLIQTYQVKTLYLKSFIR